MDKKWANELWLETNDYYYIELRTFSSIVSILI
jgi:hypothetical protein